MSTIVFQRPKKRKRSGLCIVNRCRGTAHRCGDMCSKHKMQKWRAENPLRAAFASLKSSAARRRIGFTLTLAEFEAFCEKSGYLAGRGNKEPDALQVDRINCLDGYTLDNIQVITLVENGAKGQRERYIHAGKHTEELRFA